MAEINKSIVVDSKKAFMLFVLIALLTAVSVVHKNNVGVVEEFFVLTTEPTEKYLHKTELKTGPKWIEFLHLERFFFLL